MDDQRKTDDLNLSPEEEKHFSELFKKIDANKDGRICIDDLIAALKRFKIPHASDQTDKIAEGFMERSDLNMDGHLDFQEFVQYVLKHDKQLQLAFKHMDTNDDGHIDAREIQTAFHDLGINVDMAEAERLVKRVDRDGTWKIDYNEWREFLLFLPTGKLADIVRYWRHGTSRSPIASARARRSHHHRVKESLTLASNCGIWSDFGYFIDVGEDTVIPGDFSSEERQSGKYLLTLLAGGVAGTVSRSSTAPLDRLKVLLQVHGYKHRDSGIVGGFRYMIREGGFLSLWRGNGINVIKIAPETAIKYASYERYKKIIGQYTDEIGLADGQPLLTKFLAGSMAGSTAQTIIYPMEVLKTRMCLRKTGQFNSLADCAFNVYREGGLRAFYRGYLPNLCGIVPYAGIEMALYETGKWYYTHYVHEVTLGNSFNGSRPTEAESRRQKHLNHPPVFIIPVIASCSSMCGILATYPLSLVRTKLQSKSTFKHTETNSMLGLFRTIWREDGVRGWYRGLGPNLIKVLPAVGISYGMYEFMNKELDLKTFGSK